MALSAPPSPPNALSIAGSDSSGGAGIQADLKTFAAFGVYGASVITAVTAQNTCKITAIHPIPADVIRAQIEAVLSDLQIHAIKIGMTGSAEAIEAIADALERAPNIADIPIILDPVMAATAGTSLFEADALDLLWRKLVPRTALITPNLPEAAQLLNTSPANNLDEMRNQAHQLLALGARAVLLKGGHLPNSDRATDLLLDKKGERLFQARFVPTPHTHGSGCSLASAIAAAMAQGKPLAEAVAAGKAFVTKAITTAKQLNVGQCRGPLHHFHTQ